MCIINILPKPFNSTHSSSNMGVMGAGHSSPYDGEYRPQDEEDLALSDSQTLNEATPLSEKGGLETMTTRLCPYGYEIVEDPLAAPRAGPTKPPLDEALSDLRSQLEIEGTVEVIDLKQHAAKQDKFIIALLTWALNMIDAGQSLQGSLRDVLLRFAKAQDRVVDLQKEQEEAAGIRACLEMRLRNAEILLRTAECRAVAYEKEKQRMATVSASLKRQVNRLERFEMFIPRSL